MNWFEPSPRGPPPLLSEGWLLKRSDGKQRLASFGNVNKHWNRRWFSIEGSVLSYGRERCTAAEAHAHSLCLTDSAVCETFAGASAAEFSLRSRNRVLTLCAATHAERDSWVAALVAAGAELSTNEPTRRRPAMAEQRVCATIAANLAVPVDWSAEQRDGFRRIWEALALADGLVVPTGVNGEGHSFAQESATWKVCGFQRDDPSTDFRGAGCAALAFLVWYVESAPAAAKASIAHQQRLREESGGERGLPWAAAAINCVRVVAQLLDLVTLANAPGGYAQSERRCWSLMRSVDGFFGVVRVALECVEREFEARGALYMEFNACVRSVQDALAAQLGSGAACACGSLCELRHSLKLPPAMGTEGDCAARAAAAACSGAGAACPGASLRGRPTDLARETDAAKPTSEESTSSNCSGNCSSNWSSHWSGRLTLGGSSGSLSGAGGSSGSLTGLTGPRARCSKQVRFSAERSSCPRTLVLGSLREPSWGSSSASTTLSLGI